MDKLPWEEIRRWVGASADLQAAEAAQSWMAYYVGIGLLAIIGIIFLVGGTAFVVTSTQESGKDDHQ